MDLGLWVRAILAALSAFCKVPTWCAPAMAACRLLMSFGFYFPFGYLWSSPRRRIFNRGDGFHSLVSSPFYADFGLARVLPRVLRCRGLSLPAQVIYNIVPKLSITILNYFLAVFRQCLCGRGRIGRAP